MSDEVSNAEIVSTDPNSTPEIKESLLETAETEVKAWELEIETWWQDVRMIISMDTELHNKLYAAKEALKTRLSNII